MSAIKSAVTVSLVEAARGGPFVYWHDLAGACREAKELGFDAVEVFPAAATDLATHGLADLLMDYQLGLAAVGTGAGWVQHQLTLSDPDPARRREAVDFVRAILDAAAPFDAPVIVGSMQGRDVPGVRFGPAFDRLCDSLHELYLHAPNQTILVEPLNRYETNLLNTLKDVDALTIVLCSVNVKALADLFHMNIEEADVAGALRDFGPLVGHVHFADSNRLAAGWGHTDFAPVAQAIADIGYAGYASAEVFSRPDPAAAARQTMASFRRFFR